MRTALVLAFVVLSLAVAVTAAADWNIGDPYKWFQPSDESMLSMYVNATSPYIIADDFECTETGVLTDIHIWAGWLEPSAIPEDVTFTLSIHADIPASQSPTGYSMPGDVLWTRVFEPGEFVVQLWSAMPFTGWLNPPSDYTPVVAVITTYQYNFFIDRADAFFQQGTPAEPIVYWLDVQAEPVDPGVQFGWKTTYDNWNDSAVWVEGVEPYVGEWGELIYPEAHIYAGSPVGFGFVITGESVELDWGDAPDPDYPTLASSNGANHVIVSGYYMGALVDAEPDGQPDPDALGDDTNGVPDDEDGVLFITPLVHGMNAMVDVSVSAVGFVDAWIDFGDDGSWADAGDQIAAAYPVSPPVSTISFAVPTTAAYGAEAFARFRFSSAGGLPYDGPADDGEVEDHTTPPIEGNHTFKWIQPPDLSTLGLDVEATHPYLLADDFQCDETGLILDIHIWGSWNENYLPNGDDPGAVTFKLSIHADVPDTSSPIGYSMPGELLWLRTFVPGTFFVQEWATDLEEGWYTPGGGWTWPADDTCYRYDFYIDEADAFYQEGTPGEPVVYWLDLQAYPSDPAAEFGWKTSFEHWNDDAVWFIGEEPYVGEQWNEMRYPEGHSLAGESIDLAFMITGGPVIQPLDYGDAPEPDYPTLEASGGARHFMDAPILGTWIDTEFDGQPNATATGDDLAGADDEDGVDFVSWITPGGPAAVEVTSSGPGFLNAWVDFYGNGDWADPVDQIFSNQVLTGGPAILPFSVPSGAQTGETFARFRINSTGALSYTGLADDGEVEDYMVRIVRVDWGDAPDPDYPTLRANDGANHAITAGFHLGGSVDYESNGQPNSDATGDDIAGLDDENGVRFRRPLVPGRPGRVRVIASADGLLDAWVDFQADGSWAEPDDHIFDAEPLVAGRNNLTFPVPSSAVPGETFSRFRFSSAGGLAYTGRADDGEVEDHAVMIIDPEQLKSIQYPDLGPTGIDVNATTEYLLADDFLCEFPGRITEIFVWGSWLYDEVPTEPVSFTLSIHENIPAGALYSMPGDLRWLRTFGPGEYTVELYEPEAEADWLTPPEEHIAQADTTCWLYTFTVDPEDAFHQVGTPLEPHTYWLDLQVSPAYPGYTFGWKASPDHWGGAAVWGVGVEPFSDMWIELLYPSGHPLAGEPIDLAFGVVTTYGTDVPEEEELPSSFGVDQNVPNPFNPKTTIAYHAPAGGGHVTLRIFDVSGREVATLLDEVVPEGRHSVTWEAVDDDGRELPSGVYFYRLETEESVTTKKMLLLK